MAPIKDVLQESLRGLGADNYRKFLSTEILAHWNSLVDKSISAFVTPIEIEHGILFVDVKSSAHKDQLKFYVEEIIDAINEKLEVGEQPVKEIKIARPHQVAAFNAKNLQPVAEKNSSPQKIDAVEEKSSPPQKNSSNVKPEVSCEEISLSDEEIARYKESVKKIKDPDVRWVALRSLLAQAKFQKFRLANGWHKCKTCDSLCAPTETFCEVCLLKEHEKLMRTLFAIFYDAPWLSSADVQKIFAEKFPNQRDQCPLDVVNSARTSLVQNLAARLTVDEENERSDEILRLVMLERQLPPDKITPAIVKRTLAELHFNFADPIRFQRYRFTKFRRTQQR